MGRKSTLPVAAILLVSCLNLLHFSEASFSDSLSPLGGPETDPSLSVFVSAMNPIGLNLTSSNETFQNKSLAAGFIEGSNFNFNNFSDRRTPLTYLIQAGDTAESIAVAFNISLDSLYLNNPNLKPQESLTINQELIVPQVSGLLYKVQANETLTSVAADFSVSPQLLLKYNLIVKPGELVVIPNYKPSNLTYLGNQEIKGNALKFIAPAAGWNWGELHYNNAVDIASACGSPIYAVYEGEVVEASEGYNHGYGNLVAIKHPNGVITRYAHAQSILVALGDHVAEGNVVAEMGNTGLTHGPTGCHVHFEVLGAANPFAH